MCLSSLSRTQHVLVIFLVFGIITQQGKECLCKSFTLKTKIISGEIEEKKELPTTFVASLLLILPGVQGSAISPPPSVHSPLSSLISIRRNTSQAFLLLEFSSKVAAQSFVPTPLSLHCDHSEHADTGITFSQNSFSSLQRSNTTSRVIIALEAARPLIAWLDSEGETIVVSMGTWSMPAHIEDEGSSLTQLKLRHDHFFPT